MDYADEIIQVLLAFFKKSLKIKRDIIVITDPVHWQMMFPKDEAHLNEKHQEMYDVYGLSRKDDGYIFINLDTRDTFKDLFNVILHELFHIKYPKATEKQIDRLTRQYID